MITVYLKSKYSNRSVNFESLTKALEYARSQPIGVEFKIREGKTLLAKGTIEPYKDFNYEI